MDGVERGGEVRVRMAEYFKVTIIGREGMGGPACSHGIDTFVVVVVVYTRTAAMPMVLVVWVVVVQVVLIPIMRLVVLEPTTRAEVVVEAGTPVVQVVLDL
jgi:hypothetical protein